MAKLQVGAGVSVASITMIKVYLLFGGSASYVQPSLKGCRAGLA